jgi:nitroimidazol reductase NimA-like FMN-containing flavoprotein (pyridoxamine 5'-phosphate oxidase superfamily)
MTDDAEIRPPWYARREIAPFTLDGDAIDRIVNTASHAVVSWVTKKHEPVQAVMLYVVIDDLITVTSTTNRAKYHAWRRNPAASFCIWDPEDIGRQVTLRGRMEIMQDDELLRRYVDGYLTRARGGRPPKPERLEAEIATFAAPDRHMMQLNVERVVSHDLPALLAAERDGTDAWS